MGSLHKVLHFQWQNSWAVREGDWKLIVRKANHPNAKESMTLRHLADTRPEVANYADEQPLIVTRLRSLHDAWAKDVFATAANRAME